MFGILIWFIIPLQLVYTGSSIEELILNGLKTWIKDSADKVHVHSALIFFIWSGFPFTGAWTVCKTSNDSLLTKLYTCANHWSQKVPSPIMYKSFLFIRCNILRMVCNSHLWHRHNLLSQSGSELDEFDIDSISWYCGSGSTICNKLRTRHFSTSQSTSCKLFVSEKHRIDVMVVWRFVIP